LPTSIAGDTIAIIPRAEGGVIAFSGQPNCGNYAQIARIAALRWCRLDLCEALDPPRFPARFWRRSEVFAAPAAWGPNSERNPN